MIIVTYELQDINQAKTLCSLLRGKGSFSFQTLNSFYLQLFVFYIEPDKKRQQQTDTTASNNLDGRLLSTARRSTLRFLWLKVLLDFVVEGQDESTTGASENVGESALEESA